MADRIVALRAKLTKLSISADPSPWLEEFRRRLGMYCAPPFYVTREREGGEILPTWAVCVDGRKRNDELVEGGFVSQYDALRAMIDALEAYAPIRPCDRVYFIGTELRRGALMKVGYSRDPKARLRTLQTSHPERLQIFATVEGGKDLEAKYHRRWASRRRAGEWFTVGDCIIDEIKRINAASPTLSVEVV